MRRFLVMLLKPLINIPLTPRNFIVLVQFLRKIRWLPAKHTDSEQMHRVLIIEPEHLGDLVMSIPLIDEVYRLWPDAEIDLLVDGAMISLLRDIPYIHNIFVFTKSSFKWRFAGYLRLALYHNILHMLLLYRREMSDRRYDLVLCPRWESDDQSYLARALAFLCGASIRASYSGKTDRINPKLDQFMTHLAMGGYNENEMIRKLRLLQRSGLSNRVVEDNETLQVNATLSIVSQYGKPTLCSFFKVAEIHPGDRFAILAPTASSPVRMWPIECFSEVARNLHERYGLKFLVVGTIQDVELCSQIEVMCPDIAVSIAGQTNLAELLALLARAVLFIGNDSGPGHLSGMVGCATVVIMLKRVGCDLLDHPDAPRRWRPCGPRVRLVQLEHSLPPCTLVCKSKKAHCITNVPVDSVLAACDNLLALGFERFNPAMA